MQTRCNSLANKDKATYYRALVNENSDDPKKLWQVLRSTLHCIPDKVPPSHNSHKKLADHFAAFFTNKIAKIRESFSSSSSFSLPSPVNPPGLVKFDDASPDDIAKVIKNSPTKSCLLDPWPTFLVKDCLDILLPSITKLVNCSLSEGAVPDGFKSAVVTPLIKKSSLSKDDLKNYRPVSGLSFISKLVERVVASQLSRHVSLHGLENENQSAYRRGHSTETALLSIKNQIHLSLARGEATAVVLLDQSAAFDTIDHDKHLDCLRKWISVGGRCLDWFKSYLSDRTQCKKKMNKNAKTAFDRLGKCLEDVKLWLCANKLKLNAAKTDFIIFGSKSQQEKLTPFFPVNILGESLIPSDAVKNLGVWFDSDFSFTKHVKSECKLCFIQMRDLRQIRQYLTRDAALMAANALVGSRLDYCNSLFRGLSVSNLRKLQCIQNSLARIVCRATCLSHTTPLRKALHWLPIRHRCIFKTALLVYKYLHTNCPKYLSPFLKVRQCAYNTRLSQSDGITLHVPQYQPSIYKSTKQFGLSFAYDSPKIWNELPDDV